MKLKIPKLESLAWLPGLAAALVLALAVGAMVFFVLDRRHTASFDKAVQAEVDKQIAEMMQAPGGAPPATVRVGLIEERTLQDRAALIGRLREVRRALVASEVEGRVLEVLVDQGDAVVGGETILARVDGTWARLALEQAEADLAAAQATARQSSRDLAHLEQLAQRGASDPRAIDDAIAQAEADAASELAALAAVHRAQETVARLVIVAPFDGLVTEKHAEAGQWLDQGDEVVEIVSRGQIDAHIDVPERQIGAVRPGTEIDVVVEPLNQTFVGEVVSADPDGSNAARTYVVRIRLPDHDGALKVGMSVEAHVPLMEEGRFTVVPRDAVAYSESGPRVWLATAMPGAPADSGPVALAVDVEVLFGVGEQHVAVRAVGSTPLLPGTQVATQGLEDLFPTRPLIILPGGNDNNAAHPEQSPTSAPNDVEAARHEGH